MKERSRARGWAVQALYAWESRGGGDDSLVPIFLELSENLMSPRNRLYADVLIRLVAAKRAAIDSTIQRHLTNWTLSRLSVIDRNILRIGVAEMLFVDDAPGSVTVSEMIRLAEQYGTQESPRFIKGVLDGVLREVEGAASERVG